MEYKKCKNPTCAAPLKPLTQFSKSPRNKGGLSTWCKDCQSAYGKKRYAQSDVKAKKAFQSQKNYMKKQGITSARKPLTEAQIRKEALKYQHKGDFQRDSKAHYLAARKLGQAVFESICDHMTPAANDFDNRLIYEFVWPAIVSTNGDVIHPRSTYIGQTKHKEEPRRHKDHLKMSNDPVAKHIAYRESLQKGAGAFNYSILVDHLSSQDAVKKERLEIAKAKADSETIVLNTNAGGSLGSVYIWSKAKIRRTLKQFDTIAEARKDEEGRKAYTAARNQGLLKDATIFGHIKSYNHQKPVICLDTGEEFPSTKAAARNIKRDPSTIARVCNGKQKLAGGKRWKWK